MANVKKPTAHKVLMLSAVGPDMFAKIEAQLDALTAEGWTIHITQVDCRLAQLTLYGWATK